MSEQPSISERVRNVVGFVVNVDTSIISEDDILDDIGADSLDICELAFLLEDEFDIDIADVFDPETVADCVSAVTSGLERRAA